MMSGLSVNHSILDISAANEADGMRQSGEGSNPN
jgi:hypothetical protein